MNVVLEHMDNAERDRVVAERDRIAAERDRIVSEQDRIAALRSLDLLDTPPEPEFDELVQLAAAICEAPISVVSLIDEHRQWFKAAIGIERDGSSRDVAFCDITIRGSDLLLVEDAATDVRFASNPLVTGAPHLRFYAGMPVFTPGGCAVGALCVLDRVPRKLSASQITALGVLARQVNARLELREQRLRLEVALAEAEDARQKLVASENRFQVFMDSSPFMTYLKDAEGRFVFYNQALSAKFGITPDEWLGKSDMDLFPPEIAAPYRTHDLQVLQSGKLHIVDETSRQEDGTTTFWRSYKFPCAEGDSLLLGGVSVDVSEELQHQEERRNYQKELEYANALLHQQATTDSLTGLPNRRVAQQRLATEFDTARRSGAPLCVLLLDVDNFKQCNDRHGHDAGDRTLCHLAEVLLQTVRQTDLVARYGGEEFLLILPQTSEDEAIKLGTRLLAAVRVSTWPVEPMTVSGGISQLTSGTATQERLVTLADEALYRAKRSGKSRILCNRTPHSSDLLQPKHEGRIPEYPKDAPFTSANS